MTIPTSQATEIFIGNGVTNSFDFSFVGDSADYIVVQYTDLDGNITTLSPSQYTVFLNPPTTGAIWGIGGTITYPTMGSPIASGTFLTVSRTLPLTQVISIANQGGFFPEVIEEALDTLEMQIQQVAARTGQFRGIWETGVVYNFGDYVIDGENGTDTGNYYMCVIANESGTWSTDLSSGYWVIVIDVQPIQDASNFEVVATGTTTPITLGDRFANLILVDDFGDCTNSSIDHSAIVQEAINYAASVEKGICFTSGRIYNLSAVRLTNMEKPWVVQGNGCTLNNQASSTTDIPCLYHTTLDEPGGSVRAYTYGVGTFLYNINFTGSGFGVGYKHCIDGTLAVSECTFNDLEVPLKLIGTTGVKVDNCRFIGDTGQRLIYYARVADDTYTVNYTAEGLGWNDGSHVTGCSLSGGDYGIYYGGSTSEAVLTVKGNILTAQEISAVYAKVVYSLIIEANWTEFHNGAAINLIHIDTSSGFEVSGTVRITGNYFFNNDTINYVVFNASRMLIFEDNTVHLTASTYTGVVWSSSGTTGRWTSNLILTPTRTSNFNSQGKISFANADLTYGTNNMYYMSDGTNNVILKPTTSNSPAGSEEFTMYLYTSVWPTQWAYVGPNWLNTSSPQQRTVPIGYNIDFNTPATGLTFGGPTCTLIAGIDANNLLSRPWTIIRHNNYIGVDVSKIYQQREFGYVIFDNNRKH